MLLRTFLRILLLTAVLAGWCSIASAQRHRPSDFKLSPRDLLFLLKSDSPDDYNRALDVLGSDAYFLTGAGRMGEIDENFLQEYNESIMRIYARPPFPKMETGASALAQFGFGPGVQTFCRNVRLLQNEYARAVSAMALCRVAKAVRHDDLQTSDTRQLLHAKATSDALLESIAKTGRYAHMECIKALGQIGGEESYKALLGLLNGSLLPIERWDGSYGWNETMEALVAAIREAGFGKRAAKDVVEALLTNHYADYQKIRSMGAVVRLQDAIEPHKVGEVAHELARQARDTQKTAGEIAELLLPLFTAQEFPRVKTGKLVSPGETEYRWQRYFDVIARAPR